MPAQPAPWQGTCPGAAGKAWLARDEGGNDPARLPATLVHALRPFQEVLGERPLPRREFAIDCAADTEPHGIRIACARCA